MAAWKKRFHRRGIAFFRFLANWTKYVANIAAHETVPWPDIPGYRVLVNALLNEMKLRAVTNYPDALKEAYLELLANETLLTVFVRLVLKLTK